MIERWREGKKGKKEVKGTWLQTIDEWDSELKKIKIKILAIYASAYIQVRADFKVQHESWTLIQRLLVMSNPKMGILGWCQWPSLSYNYNNKTGSMLTWCSHTVSPWLIATYYHSHHHIVSIQNAVHDKCWTRRHACFICESGRQDFGYPFHLIRYKIPFLFGDTFDCRTDSTS